VANKAGKIVAKAWEPLLNQLDALQHAGLGVFLIAHSTIRKFSNPEAADYDRWQSLSKHFWDRIYAWADIVLFGGFEVTLAKKNKRQNDAEEKAKASGGEHRVLYTERRAAFDAKNRHGLPPRIDCGNSAADAWSNFISALKAKK
jgi:hypothetical protein